MVVSKKEWESIVNFACKRFFKAAGGAARVEVLDASKPAERLVIRPHTHFIVRTNRKRGTVQIFNLWNGKSGSAKCVSGEEFNLYTGIGLAWMRYCGEEIPSVTPIVAEIRIGSCIKLDAYTNTWMVVGKHPIDGSYILENKSGSSAYGGFIKVNGDESVREIL